MQRSTRNHRTTNPSFALPKVDGIAPSSPTLPFNGELVKETGFSFSFTCFNREHELFNLGGPAPNGIVESDWFLELLDCFRSICKMTFTEAKASTHHLHPVDWQDANVAPPTDSNQHEYWQFSISKSKGRVIGIRLDKVFYVVWLDPHHNLTDSDGYGKAMPYGRPLCIFEKNENRISELTERVEYLEGELAAANELLDKYADD